MIFSKVIAPAFVLAGSSLAQSVTLSGWSQATIGSTVISVPSGFPDLTGTILSCPVSQFSWAGKKKKATLTTLGVHNLRRACGLRRILRCQLQVHTRVHVRCVQYHRVCQLPQGEMYGQLGM